MRAKFILTVDSNKLAKWLRLLGYDSKVIKSISILNMIRIAKKEKRIIVSRSKEVLKHPLDFERIFIHSNDPKEQLQEMKEIISFDSNQLFTRCPEDNNELKSIEKEKILHLIPEKVANSFHDFKVCQKCGRVYWHGSHFKDIESELKKVLKII